MDVYVLSSNSSSFHYVEIVQCCNIKCDAGDLDGEGRKVVVALNVPITGKGFPVAETQRSLGDWRLGCPKLFHTFSKQKLSCTPLSTSNSHLPIHL